MILPGSNFVRDNAQRLKPALVSGGCGPIQIVPIQNVAMHTDWSGFFQNREKVAAGNE
jgi:hypothetical protein